MSNVSCNIVVLDVTGNAVRNRTAFLEALSAAGHHVTVCARAQQADKGRLLESLKDRRPHFLLLFCSDYSAAYYAGLDWLLDEIPYVTVWDSNPMRYLFFLTQHRETHLALLVFDTKIVSALHERGLGQAAYFPYYYADPGVFRPLPVVDAYSHRTAFAGTFYPPHLVTHDAAVVWTDDMKRLAREFATTREQGQRYLDVYEFLNDRIDVSSSSGQELSVHLMFVQKWLERNQLVETFHLAGVELHVYGGLQASYDQVNRNGAVHLNSPWVHLHGFLDKHEELPKLYASTAMHLCCTQFPRACHERVFQAAACGSFLLHEWKEDVPDLFEPGQEIVMYRKLEELPELVQRYDRDGAARSAISRAARRRFLSEHQPAHRAKQFTEIIQKQWEHLDVKTAAAAVPS